MDALAWGAVGALAFLVLAQGYRLFDGSVGFLPLLAVAAVVFAVASTAAYAFAARLPKRRL